MQLVYFPLFVVLQCSRLSVPVVFTLSVGHLLEPTSTSFLENPIIEDLKAELLVEVLDVAHYPDKAPNISLEFKNVSRRLAQEIHRAVESIVVDWSLKR